MDAAMVAAVLGGLLTAATWAAGSPYDVADQLSIVPTPREITLDGARLDLEGWVIVPAEGCSMSAIGADEINDRVDSLGGETLTVASETGGSGAIIVGSVADPLTQQATTSLGMVLSETDPGEQGYVIAVGEHGGLPVILCGGADPQGALYACVTLRHMIQREDGRTVALSGRVRDWPDYKYRCNWRMNLRAIGPAAGNPDRMAAATAAARAEVDFCLRHKINQAFGRLWELSGNEEARTAQTEVLRYAAEHGVGVRYVGSTHIEDYLSEAELAVALKRGPKHAFIWSALDAHREHARDLADQLATVQAGMFALHPYDGGAFIDPERWSARPPQDVERYGDDRAQASIEQFQLYFDAICQAVPGILLEAVSYPYHYQFALPDFDTYYQQMDVPPYRNWVRGIESPEHARDVRRRLVDYHRRLSEALEADVFITFREAGRPIFLACAQLYEGHPITIWTYPETYKGWHGLFLPQSRFAASFWRPEQSDYWFQAGGFIVGRDQRVQYLAQQEYLWSVDRPDASDGFTVRSRLYSEEGSTSDFQRDSLIPRICRVLYGPAAEAIAPLIAANASFNYVADPGGVANEPSGEAFDDPYVYLAEQEELMARCHADLAQLLDRAATGSVQDAHGDIRELDAWASLLYYYKYTGICAEKAALEQVVQHVRSLAAEGRADDARAAADRAKAVLPEVAARVRAIHERVDGDPAMRSPVGDNEKALHAFDPTACAARLDQALAAGE
jgi:hypothetical protein